MDVVQDLRGLTGFAFVGPFQLPLFFLLLLR